MADGIDQLPVDRTIPCSHPSHAGYEKDFSEFWTGAPDSKLTSRGDKKKWNGGFRGRPALADALWPELRNYLIGKKPSIFNNAISALRAFWRFLDDYEQYGTERISQLSDISTSLSILWLNPIDEMWSEHSRQAHELIGILVRSARHREKMQSAWAWHPYPRAEATASKELPTEGQVRSAMHLLKQNAYEIYARWKRADALAETGRNLLTISRNRQGDRNQKGQLKSAFDFELTEADAHATYRAYIASSGHPLPSMADLFVALGLNGKDYPPWWPTYSQHHPLAGQVVRWQAIVAGLYPTSDDIDCLSQLCMARSGWNPSTVFELNTSTDEWAHPHGEAGSPLWLIESLKNRSNTWQWTISPQRLSTGFHHIVKTLIARTQPLKDLSARDASCCSHQDLISRSCWIYAGLTNAGHARVSVRSDHNGTIGSQYWKRLVREHNRVANPDKQIPETITPSDWRDIYASYVFKDSRYSWVLVQWALGHKHMSTTRHYLRRMLWRRYSEKKLAELQIVLIDGIESHGRVDATILRAKVDLGLEPSDSDIARLEAHRRIVHERELSYAGYGCADRLHPPQEIDPGNPSDGTMPCRRGDRCPLCPQGLAIDALHMCKSVAELRWLKRNVSATVWLESDYAARLDVLEVDLRQWPADEVNRHVTHWEGEIDAGRVKVIRFGSKQ